MKKTGITIRHIKRKQMDKIIKRIVWLIIFTTITLVAAIFYTLFGLLLWILTGKLYIAETVFKLFDKIEFLIEK